MNRRFLHLMKVFGRETFRHKVDVFFTVFFPILFLLIFGNMFLMTGDDEDPVWRIGVTGEIPEDFAGYFAPHTVSPFDDRGALKEGVEERQVHIGLLIGEDREVEIYQTSSMMDAGEGIFLRRFVETAYRRSLMEMEEALIRVEPDRIALGEVDATEIDYLVTGVMALSILSGGMFSVLGIFGRYKRQQVIKRFMGTPVRPWEFVVSAGVTKILLNFLAVLIVLQLARVVFGVNMVFSIPVFILLVLSTSIGMMGLGVILLLVFRKTETAYTAASLLYTFMTFFSGVYFPVAFLPDQIQWLSSILPVTYTVDLLRYGAGIETMAGGTFAFINTAFILAGGGLLLLGSKTFVTSEDNQ